jgi:hypothetical protein
MQGDCPEIISKLPEVQWYGKNPVQNIESSDIRAMYGDTIIYTRSATRVLDTLISLGYNKHDLFWQDLDGYGATKVFSRK